MIPEQYVSVLKNANFWKLWVSQFCSQLTNYLLGFAVLVNVFRTTESSAAVSLIMVSFGLATVFFGALGGVFADRFDRKWLLVWVNVLQMITVAFYILAHDNLWSLAAITFIYSSLNQFYLPVESPSIPNLVRHELILVANSYFAFTASASLIIGFAIAGPLIGSFGPAATFTVTVLLLLLASIASLLLPSIKPEHPGETAPVRSFWREFKEGVGYFWNTKVLHMPLLSLIYAQLINGMLITLAPAFIEKVLKVQLESSLLVIAPLGLGILGGALFLGFESRYIEKRGQILLGFFGMGLTLIALYSLNYVSVKMPFYIGFSFILGFFNAHIFAPSHSILQSHALNHVRGRVYGALYVMLQIAGTFPTLIIGLLADFFTVLSVMALLGVLLLGVGGYLSRTKYALT